MRVSISDVVATVRAGVREEDGGGASQAQPRAHEIYAAELPECPRIPAVVAGADGARGSLTRVGKPAEHAHGLKTRDDLTARLKEATADTGVHHRARGEAVCHHRISPVGGATGVAAAQVEVEQPSASRRCELQEAEACETRPRAELGGPLTAVKRCGVGSQALARDDRG